MLMLKIEILLHLIILNTLYYYELQSISTYCKKKDNS